MTALSYGTIEVLAYLLVFTLLFGSVLIVLLVGFLCFVAKVPAPVFFYGYSALKAITRLRLSAVPTTIKNVSAPTCHF
jgi:hypothetical protein